MSERGHLRSGYLNAPGDAVVTSAADGPRLTEATRAQIRDLGARYPQRRTALLPALKLAQAEAGYLPPELIAEVADLLSLPHAAAAELAAFYTMLHTVPVGATHVVVCAQLPCALNGAERLLRDLSAGLGILPGETTPGGGVTLERTSECFGACHRAPMARINEDYAERLTPEATQRLIEALRARATDALQTGNGEVRR